MTKHAKNSNHLQAVDMPKTMAVEIPLPLLEAFGEIENRLSRFGDDSRVRHPDDVRTLDPARLRKYGGMSQNMLIF
jgi:hypothetical protein